MKQQKERYILFLFAIIMILVIFDSKASLESAREGVSQCMATILPALFPFFFLSSIINNRLSGYHLSVLDPIAKLCGIPKGAESILLLGILGGYPIGAQVISQTYHAGTISKMSAKRMLGFCNNAGPAFIFGMLSGCFSSPAIPWLIWGIHVTAALLTGILLPLKMQESCILHNRKPLLITEALESSIRAIAKVCGWVILFKVFLNFFNRWFLWLLPLEINVFISGVIELANGCIQLNSIPNEYIRFILCNCLLSFGGLCVGMQTMGTTSELGTGMYFPGKILQTLLSFLLSAAVGCAFYNSFQIPIFLYTSVMLITITYILILMQRYKKRCSFSLTKAV